MRGYKAYVQHQKLPAFTCPADANSSHNSTLKNPRVSDEAKQHARDVLDAELGGDQPSFDIYEAQDAGKEPTRVVGGLKA